MDKPAQGETPPRGGVGAAEIAAQYGSAWTNLGRGLHDRAASYQKQQYEAWTACEKVRQEVQDESQKRGAEAYRDYVKAAQDAMGADNAQQKLQEAYQNYVATLQGLHEAAASRLQDAYRELTEKAARLSADAQQQQRQQYVDYLASVKQIWAGWSPDSIG